ncbi:MAG: TPM domain-containing protein [Panacagrimonas sp.]
MTAATRSFLVLLISLYWAGVATAEVAVPELRARVTDLTGTLGSSQRAALESKLTAFEKEKGSQIAVLLLPTTQPETIEQYSIRVADAWKLGRAEQDDGVLLLVAKNDRALRIEVGRGLEGAIPDAIGKRIVEEIMLPHFRDGAFYRGIDAGVDRILGLIRGEALPEPAREVEISGPSFEGNWMGLLLAGVLFIGQMLRRMLGRLLGAGLAGLIVFALAMLLLGTLGIALVMGIAAFVLSFLLSFGGFAGGGWSSGRSGGGFSGGGFRGGGGSFGGGGASGRW